MDVYNQTILPLKDNRFGDCAQPIPKAICDAGLLDTLKRFQGKNLLEWRKEGVTVFKAHGQDNESNKTAFFGLSSIGENGDYKISTWNSMGVIRLRDKEHGGSIQIEIGSRFDTGEKPFFMAYLLSKVFGGSVVDSIALSRESIWDMLLAFAFRRLFLEAGKLGPYRQYRTFEHNDIRLRGRIDVDRHLRQNIPFRGNVSYATHEISFDNPTNHLIRHALVKVSRKWGGMFTADGYLTRLSRELTERTPTWETRGVLGCVSKNGNRKPIRHPYFHAAYEPLRKISLSILRDEGAGLYHQEQEAEGVIFDGAWLWEEYIWTLLKEFGFEHPENRISKGAWTPIDKIAYYPDFFHREKQIVLDTKYKRSGRDRDDVRQVFTYMFILDAIHGGLIKPEKGEVEHEDIDRERKDARAAKWHEFDLIPASNATNAQNFVAAMKLNEKIFKTAIRDTFGFSA